MKRIYKIKITKHREIQVRVTNFQSNSARLYTKDYTISTLIKTINRLKSSDLYLKHCPSHHRSELRIEHVPSECKVDAFFFNNMTCF